MEEPLLQDVSVGKDWNGRSHQANVYLVGHKLIVKHAKTPGLIKKEIALGQEPVWFEVDLREARVTAELSVIKFTHLDGKKLNVFLRYPVIRLVPTNRPKHAVVQLLETLERSGEAKQIASRLNSFTRIQA